MLARYKYGKNVVKIIKSFTIAGEKHLLVKEIESEQIRSLTEDRLEKACGCLWENTPVIFSHQYENKDLKCTGYIKGFIKPNTYKVVIHKIVEGNLAWVDTRLLIGKTVFLNENEIEIHADINETDLIKRQELMGNYFVSEI